MYIDFIFFKRQFESKNNLENDVKKFMQAKLNYKSGCIDYKGNNIKCSIDNSNINKAVPVRIEIDDETENNIEIFSICKEMIKNHSKEDFFLNISYDGLSNYFSYHLYPGLAEFETKLRSIAYSTLINDLGYDWVNESFLHNENTKVKLDEIEGKEEKNKEKEYSKLITRALEKFYLKDLGTYLFTEYQYPNDYMITDELLNLVKSGSINQEKVKDIESKRVPRSLVNRYFENVDLEYIKDKFSLINDARNDVMHHKEISMKKYNRYNEILEKSLRIVNSLHDEINIGKYKKVGIGEIASAFGNAYRSMDKYNESIENLRNMINTELSISSKSSINLIGESIKSQIPKAAIESLMVPMNEYFSNIANITQSPLGYQTAIGDFSKMQSQVGKLAGMPKFQDYTEPSISKITNNTLINAIENQNKSFMKLNPNFVESFLDDEIIDNDDIE